MLSSRVIGNGSDVVLLHGWGMNGAVWSSWVPFLEKHYRLTIIDLPGHGESEYECSDMDSWVDAVLEVAPKNAIYMGWSLGGQIALACALKEEKRVSKMVLIAATPKFVTATDWADATDLKTLQQFYVALAKAPEVTLNRFLALQVRGAEQAKETLRELKLLLSKKPKANASALDQGLQFLIENDFRSALPKIKKETLWLSGERDTLVPKSVLNEIKKLMPKAVFEEVAEAGHAPMLSHPKLTIEKVNGFLNG